jgi:uncharacterized phage protein (predicted DNA packaging)|nr:MAG TPA: head tail connector [Caudoviricetes sp.]
MKVSELQPSDVIRYMRLDEDGEEELPLYLDAAVHYVSSALGLPVSADGIEDCLDNHPDITIAVLALCGDMYDNRSVYVDGAVMNRTVETVLAMYNANIG